jgi:hypothetical protein
MNSNEMQNNNLIKRILAVEARVLSQVVLCGIYCEHGRTRLGFSWSTAVFPIAVSSTYAPYSLRDTHYIISAIIGIFSQERENKSYDWVS